MIAADFGKTTPSIIPGERPFRHPRVEFRARVPWTKSGVGFEIRRRTRRLGPLQIQYLGFGITRYRLYGAKELLSTNYVYYPTAPMVMPPRWRFSFV